ncbi:MAG: hypothetical protein EB164_01425 [Thaumarchaeota archaeon]|nr:hypothetical protein [Nitrososphaerota archaeon]
MFGIVDKYLLVMLAILILGMVFTAFKGLADQNLYLFYAQLAGALIIIGYSTMKDRNRIKSSRKRK